jgi:hypothetical protein
VASQTGVLRLSCVETNVNLHGTRPWHLRQVFCGYPV